jgi:Spirocyclase AveC-like
MTATGTEQLSAHTTSHPTRRTLRSSWPWLLAIAGAVGIAVAAWNARDYPDARIGNPAVTGSPRPVHYLFGYEHWMAVLEIFTVIAVVALIAVFVWGFRRYGAHPVLLMGVVTTFIVWQDPMMNWAPYAFYNPRMWHFPESWPIVSLSPSIEPFVVIGYVMFQLGPYFPAVWALRKIQTRQAHDSFVWRHPLISLGVLIFIFGFLLDMVLELTLIRIGMYVYTQVPPWGSVEIGTPFQFPLIWESAGVTLVMIPAGVLIYRDDTGRTVAEKMARKLRILPRHPAWAMFTVMMVIVNVAYLMYGAGFLVLKVSHVSTSVACPWPYPDAKIFDPQGFYEQNGQKGPYSVGIMSTFMNGQPPGRPHVQAPPPGQGRCAAGASS